MRTAVMGAADANGFRPALERLREEAGARFGAGRATLRPVSLVRRRFSKLLFADVNTADRVYQIVLKRVHPVAGDPGHIEPDLRREYEAMKGTYDAIASEPGLRAARPIAFYPDLATIVTERLTGLTLREVLQARAVRWSKPLDAGRLERIAAGIGRWLRTFQGSRDTRGRTSVDALRSYLRVRLSRAARRRWLALSAPARAAIEKRFEDIAASLRDTDLVLARAHGDLNPENIIVDPEGDTIGVLDFVMERPAVRLHDLTYLYTSLEITCARAWYRPDVVTRLMAALVAAYDAHLTCQASLFQILLLQHRVARLAGLIDHPTLDGIIVRRWLERDCAAVRV